MAAIVTVDDPDDPRLADYARLTDVRLRTSMEEEHGLFVAEGEKVIRRAVAAGYRPRSLLLTPAHMGSLGELAATLPGPVYLVTPEVAEQITGYRVHRGALASMARRPLPTVGHVLAGRAAPARCTVEGGGGRPGGGGLTPPRRVIVLEDLVDHGNVGGIFRCAAALGIGAVVLSPRCADPLYRRAIKVSMGAVFAIPYARMTGWRQGLGEIRDAGFRLLALTPDQSAPPMSTALAGERALAGGTAPGGGPAPARGTALGGAVAAGAEKIALLLGTEGDGLSSRWLHEADQAVCIPMSAGAMALGVDSLNVVAAAAIACHELARDQ